MGVEDQRPAVRRRSLPGRPPNRGARDPNPTGFQRLALTHALMSSGEAVLVVALGSSLFLSISPDAARSKVLLYLLISVAPFAVVAPLIGPAVDRMAGGRRLMIQLAAIGRMVVAVLMITNLDSLLLFPLAFAAMVLQKTYGVAKTALVPTVVSADHELVEANSKLGIISGVVGFVAVIPAAVLQLISARLTLTFDALLFLVAAATATRLPRDVVASHREAAAERIELRSTAIVLAASAMALMRATVGFLFFQLAFWLRHQSAGTAWFALAAAMAAIGTLIGNAIGPSLRRSAREELMLVGSLALSAATGVLATLLGGVSAAVLLMAVVNFSAAVGRLAFNAIVHRNAPDANQGRAFAQFETKFQLAWVAAGIIPVLIPIPGALGFLIVGAISAFACVTYLVSSKRVRRGLPMPEPLARRARRELNRRRSVRRTATGGLDRPEPPEPGLSSRR